MNRERGVTMVLVALCLSVLLFIAAFAVDVGAAYNERRQDQSAADAGALAGAVEVSFLTPTAQAITDQVLDHVSATLDVPIGDSAWLASCPSSEPPPGFVKISSAGLGAATPATNCISISGEELRVRVPTQEVKTQFARIFGFNSLSVHAVAHARIELPLVAQTPPFVVPPSGASSGNEVCLRSTSGGPVVEPAVLPYDSNGNGTNGDPDDLDPCHSARYSSGPGAFGTVDPTSYRFNPCDVGTDVLEVGLAAGIDHTLSRFATDYVPGATGVRQDGAMCNASVGPLFPNSMRVSSGISTPTLTCGLTGRTGGGCTSTGPTYNSTSHLARLRRGEFVDAGYTWGGRPIDSKPLWEFLVANTSAPAVCQPSSFGAGPASYVGNMNNLLSCLRTWSPAQGPIFGESILGSSRFTFLPVLAEAGVSAAPNCANDVGAGNVAKAGGQCVHFNDFVPAFFHRLYGKVAGASTGACDPGPPGGLRLARMTVGDGYSTCGASDIDMVSGLVFSCGMLPEAICRQRPSVTPSDPTGDPVFSIRLVK